MTAKDGLGAPTPWVAVWPTGSGPEDAGERKTELCLWARASGSLSPTADTMVSSWDDFNLYWLKNCCDFGLNNDSKSGFVEQKQPWFQTSEKLQASMFLEVEKQGKSGHSSLGHQWSQLIPAASCSTISPFLRTLRHWNYWDSCGVQAKFWSQL